MTKPAPLPLQEVYALIRVLPYRLGKHSQVGDSLPLAGDFVGGIAPQPTELQEINFPSGQDIVEIGVNMGVGVDVHLAKRLILGAEYRYNALTRNNASHGTFGGRIGLRF